MIAAGLVALCSAEPMLFPSLGPTVIMCIERPMATGSAPRNVWLAHAGGLVAGWLSLALFGLLDASSAFALGVQGARIGAAALSLTLTVAIMRLVRAPHPPAGATTLIVSLGLLSSVADLALMFAAIVGATVAAGLFNRLMGIPVPLWAPRSTLTDSA